MSSEKTGLDSEELPGADHRINLFGENCPETFVRASAAMDELEAGDILEVLVDDKRSSERVPRNMENHGHDHLKTIALTGHWKLLIRKQEKEVQARWLVVG